MLVLQRFCSYLLSSYVTQVLWGAGLSILHRATQNQFRRLVIAFTWRIGLSEDNTNSGCIHALFYDILCNYLRLFNCAELRAWVSFHQTWWLVFAAINDFHSQPRMLIDVKAV